MNEFEQGVLDNIKSVNKFLTEIPIYTPEDGLDVDYELIIGTVLTGSSIDVESYLLASKAKSIGRLLIQSMISEEDNKLRFKSNTKPTIADFNSLLSVIDKDKPDFVICGREIDKLFVDRLREGGKQFKYINNVLSYNGTHILRNDYLFTKDGPHTIYYGDYKIGAIRDGIALVIKDISYSMNNEIGTLSVECGIHNPPNSVCKIKMERSK